MRSHGAHLAPEESQKKHTERTFETFVPLSVGPSKRLRVLARSPNDAAETLAAAEAAGSKAKEILRNSKQGDLDSLETSLVPVTTNFPHEFNKRQIGCRQ